MTFSKCISVVLLTSMLGACSNNGQGINVSNSDIGGVLGGVGGALVGSTIGNGNGQLAAVAVGAGLGALGGSAIGQSYDNNGQNN